MYLQPSEYVQYGLEEETRDDLVAAASGLIDAFCRRPGLDVEQYTERLRFAPGSNTVRISHLPLTPLAPATNAIVSARVRLARSRALREMCFEPLVQAIEAFGLCGTWTNVDVTTLELSLTGEVTVPRHLFGVPFDEVEMTYTAGWSTVPTAVKQACAQIVRNAQATPALNVKSSSITAMRMDYFSATLLDDDVRARLQPYLAVRVGG